MASFDYDVVIVGSGFGGSVAALRAAEKGYRVGVMESGRRWKDEDIPKTQWDLPRLPVVARGRAVRHPAGRVPRRCARPLRRGRRRRVARLCQHAVRPAEAVLRRAGVGEHHRLGRRAGAVLDQATRMLGVVRYPYMPTDVDRVMQEVASRSGAGETFNKAPVGRLLRQPGRRGRRSVLRRRRAAAHRLHLVRQLQHRLWPQRQEQADDELPLPGGEARAPRSTSCTRCTTSSRSTAAGSRSTRGIPAGRSGRAHLHRHTYTAEQVIVAAHAYGSAKLLHHMQHEGRLTGPVEPARAAGADELRAAARDHADARRVGARSGEDPPHAGVGLDHLRGLAGSGDEHRARLLGRRQRPVRVPGHLPPARRAEASDRVVAQGADRTPDQGAQLRRPAPLVRADGGHAVLADDRHLDRAVLARRSAAQPARARHASRRCTSRSSRTSSTGWPRRWAATRGRCSSRSSTATPRPTSSAGSRSARRSETGAVDPYLRLFGQPGLHVMDGSVMPANTGREPVAHDHRPGRARDVAVAEQGRDRPQAAPGLRLRARRPGHAAPSGRARGRAGRAATRRRRRPTSSPTTRTEPRDERRQTMTELAADGLRTRRAARRDPERLRRSVLPGRPQAADLGRARRRPPVRVRRPLHVRRRALPAVRRACSPGRRSCASATAPGSTSPPAP